MAFHFPWKIHSIRKSGAAPHDLLVEIEHTHLLELYQTALIEVDRRFAELPKPEHSGTPEFREHQTLKHNRQHYAEMIEWLSTLQR